VEPTRDRIAEVLKAYYAAIFALRIAVNRLTWAIVKDIPAEEGKILHVANNSYACIGAKLPCKGARWMSLFVKVPGFHERVGCGDISPIPYALECFVDVIRDTFLEDKHKYPSEVGPIPEPEIFAVIEANLPYRAATDDVKRLGQEIAKRMMESGEELPPAIERQAWKNGPEPDPHKGWLVFNDGLIDGYDSIFELPAREMISPRIWSNVQDDNAAQSPHKYIPFLQYLLIQ
jgi:hypothetical protein